MNKVTETLLPLLAKAFGADVDLVSEEGPDDGPILVTWRIHRAEGERPFRRDPSILVSLDGSTLRWAQAPGYPDRAFSLKDLAEADPANEANRHPRTMEIASRLASSLCAANLMTPSGGVALVAALREYGLWPHSAAALVASATGQGFWELLSHAYAAWRYRSTQGNLALPPPYSKEEDAAVHSIISEDWFKKELVENGHILEGGALFLPVITNKGSGLHCAGT